LRTIATGELLEGVSAVPAMLYRALLYPVLLAPVLLAPSLLLAPAPAYAQNIGQRVVQGLVVDAASNPSAGATVFLKNLKHKSIRSFTSDPTGRFRFAQVDMAEDQELWAEKAGHKSPVKTVSEWDARKVFETELKLK
jgi:hypothetical protein